MKKIKVAIVAPSFGETGGPEIAVKTLVNAFLRRKDVDVTLFAPKDWKIKSKHFPTIPQSLWSMKGFKQQTEYFRRNLILENILKVTLHQDKFDIIHLNSYRYAYAVATLLHKPCLLTLHSGITKQEFEQMLRVKIFPVALSKRHKRNYKVAAIINNGISIGNIKPSYSRGKYLLTAGRLLDNKGIDIAIKVAKKTGKKLLIFGRVGVGQDRQDYFNKKINPFLNNQIVYMGEASQERLFSYLKNAEALLFPIKARQERGKLAKLSMCPLIVMESLACGTPVIGSRVYPLEEMAGWKKVAFLSENPNDLAVAARGIERFDRKTCRTFAENNFSSDIMAGKYVQLYKKILSKGKGEF
jgi:glycosyltransferase involved in cell wall biosynthesis